MSQQFQGQKLIMALLVMVAMINSVIGSYECEVYDSHMGATFDLRDLARHPGEQAYTISDGDIPCTAKIEQNYTYYFNICGTVPSLPASCRDVSGASVAGALQVNQRDTVDANDDWCYAVGYYDFNTKLKLIDESDPTLGIILTYYGSYCTGAKAPRAFNIRMECADKMNPAPLHALELAACSYDVTMPSIYGCPLECPMGGPQRKLCGGNGHCAYDTDKHAARCFCNNGYGGNDCSGPASSSGAPPLNYSPALLGLIVTIFILIGVLGASVVLMVRQMSAYKDDLTNYQVLKGGDEGDSTTV